MNPLQIQLDRVRRRRWLVFGIAVLAVLSAVAVSYMQDTVYTAKAALTTSSQNRAPDQDAFLAQGYAQFFNEDSYQELIGAAAEVPPGVTFSARTAATSPILYIEVSSTERETAVEYAAKLAVTFRDNVGGQLTSGRDEVLADMRRQIDEATTRMDQLPSPSDERVIVLQEIFALEATATEIQNDTTNQLRDLQLYAGVSSDTPNLLLNAVLALVGGLGFGVVMALAVAGFENRISSPQEARERLGLATLAVIHDNGRDVWDGARAQRLKGLANVVSLTELKRPATLAVVSARPTEVRPQVAEGLAYYRAAQGERTLLLQTDLHRSMMAGSESRPRGVAEYLAARPSLPLEPVRTAAGMIGMLVVTGGSSGHDPYELFAHEKFMELVSEATTLADLVVIDAPPIIDAAESQVICAAADRTILVIEEGVTRASDAAEACELLDQVGATLLGVVIARPAGAKAAKSYLHALSSAEAEEAATAWEAAPERFRPDGAAEDTIPAPSVDHPTTNGKVKPSPVKRELADSEVGPDA